MSRNELPEDGDWGAVHTAIHRQMKKLDMSIARLSRESGVSQPTIRYIGRPEKRQRSTLVALSAALGYPYNFLVDVLHGAADPQAPSRSVAEMTLIKNLLRAELDSMLRAELDPMREELDGLGSALRMLDGKMDVILDLSRKGLAARPSPRVAARVGGRFPGFGRGGRLFCRVLQRSSRRTSL